MTAKRATSKRKDVAQVPPTNATGDQTATGTAIKEAQRTDIPKGKDRGSQTPIVGKPKADVEKSKPSGNQAKPAVFTSNGTIPHGMVASASGPIPASALGLSPEEAEKRAKAAQDSLTLIQKQKQQKLSDATIGRVGRAELLAIGHTRGYDLDINAGTKATRAAFAAAQSKDKNLSGEI